MSFHDQIRNTIITLCMLIFGSAVPFPISPCPGVISQFGKFLCLLWQVLKHSTFLCLLSQNTQHAEFLFPFRRPHVYTCHQTAGLCGHWSQAIIFQFDSTTGFWLAPQGPGWQTQSPKASNWLLRDLLRGNMLTCGERHILFKKLCLSLFWVSLPQPCLLASFHGNEKIYSG